MSHDRPANRSDMLELAAEFRTGFESLAAALTKSVEAMQPAGQVQQVNIPQQEPVRADRPMWIMAGLVLLMGFITVMAVVVAMFQGQRVTDLRGDMQTERIERKLHEQWAAQEANTMRTFAKTGVLAPMQPRPEYKPPEGKK